MFPEKFLVNDCSFHHQKSHSYTFIFVVVYMKVLAHFYRPQTKGNMFTGVCLSTGGVPAPGGCLLLGGVPAPGGVPDGTHPTGMHSCFTRNCLRSETETETDVFPTH